LAYATQLGQVIYKIHQIPIPEDVDAGFLTADNWASFIQAEKERAHHKFAKKYESLPEVAPVLLPTKVSASDCPTRYLLTR
jgi:hypothetical protein